MELEFNTKVTVEIDYDSQTPKDLTYESRESSSLIKYFAAIEIREQGIKGISLYAASQKITLDVELLNGEDPEFFLFHVNITNIDTENPTEFELGNDLFPETLSLTLTDIVKIDEKNFTANATAVLQF